MIGTAQDPERDFGFGIQADRDRDSAVDSNIDEWVKAGGLKGILFLQESLPFHGGAPRKLQCLVRRLPAGSIHVGSMLATADSILPALAECGARTVELGTAGLLPAAERLRRYVREHRIRAVFALSFRTYCAAKAATCFLNCKTVFWASDLALERKPLKRALFGLLSRGDWVLGGSRILVSAHADPSGPRAVLLHNGVETPQVIDRIQARRELGMPEDATVLLYAADCKPYKDHDTLFRAFGKVAPRHPGLMLFLCGRQDGLARLALDRLGPYAGRVRLFGPRDDMFRFYSAADIYVHPCGIEAFGNAAVEAMLAGLPVVAAAGGGMPEIIGDGGLLVPPRDPEALAEALERLLAIPGWRRELAERGRAQAEARFRPEVFARNFLGICRRVLEEK